MNEAPKAWYASKTIWAGVITVAAFALKLWKGTEFSLFDQQQAVDLIVALVSAVGGILTIAGRLVAKAPISSPTAKG
ncbi:MAG: hypothetical protein ABIT01_19575 [Thermoanaerobaculia bacterium]